MQLGTVRGLLKRRILVNFRVRAEAIQPQLPPGFRPKLLDGWAVAGICLIRLERLRPAFLPVSLGFASENAAHRVAVVRTLEDGAAREGVYVLRRDTNSGFNAWAGGRLFPGEHHRADFDVKDDGGPIDVSMRSRDGEVTVRLRARPAQMLPATSRFRSLPEASEFFERGDLGYSPARGGERLEALRLATAAWRVDPLAVEEVHASWFADPSRFPTGSVEFDCALLMRNVEHAWIPEPSVATCASAAPC